MAASEDDFVMATNNSSIVSKRSVERLYYPEPHFIRYFVKKPMRRSPVIHRGYWLRMRAVSELVRIFLERTSSRPKVVLNLGCGADPLPFKWLVTEPSLCKNVKFIDVDHGRLMATKKDLILTTPPLCNSIGGEEQQASSQQVLLTRKSYTAIGCDLRDLSSLDSAVKSILTDTNPTILCLAEVSIAYMPTQEADALIKWASTLSDEVTFGLLEQFLPAGPHHPFAKTMLQHFTKLKSPLQSIKSYPSLDSQGQRFDRLGWTNTVTTSLWNLWRNAAFISAMEKEHLDNVEPFDEWEEFSLFASHYFLLVASNCPLPQKMLNLAATANDTRHREATLVATLNSQFFKTHKLKGRRRHAAILEVDNQAMCIHGGMGGQSRLGSCDTYVNKDSSTRAIASPPAASRQCHTITTIGKVRALLVGGRSSPSNAMSDCWLWTSNNWKRAGSLPEPRFRHMISTVAHKSEAGVVIFGGKADQRTVVGDWLFWEEEQGWRKLTVLGQSPEARFGGNMVLIGSNFGLLFGGINDVGVILRDIWTWRVLPDTCAVELSCLYNTDDDQLADFTQLCRFGATAHILDNKLAIIGGLGIDGCLDQTEEVMFFDINPDDKFPLANPSRSTIQSFQSDVPRPLLVGHCSFVGASGELVVFGGGAVCFSFGTFSNDGIWAFSEHVLGSDQVWTVKEHDETSDYKSNVLDQPLASAKIPGNPSSICSQSLGPNGKDFEKILMAAVPVVFRGVDLGSCTQRWSSSYLKEAVGSERPVIVHSPQSTDMNFQKKNFEYITISFGEFLSRADGGERLYLRSISSNKPSQSPASLSQDFPSLADDFVLPPSLDFAKQHAHSSVLRISNTKMWLHYDTRANIFCSIRGSRKLILYPPSDVTHLAFPPGASTSQLDIFENDSGSTSSLPRSVPNTHPHEVILTPGDVLFIPPLWLHAGAPTTGEGRGGDVSVAVNVFFSSFEEGYAAGRDVYGNRDLQAYETGRRDLERIVKAFRGLPTDVAQAYIRRLAVELAEKGEALTSGPP